MPDPQYTDAQLSDGRTLRFMGQLGPDEVRQKVQHFRATESISQNPPGVQRPANPIQRDPTYHDYETIGSSEGAGLAEGLSDWDKASFGEMGGGAADVARGNFSRGAHRMISGVGAATVPVLPFAAAAAPVPLAKAMIGGTLASKVARSGAEGLGATPDQADLAGDVGGIAGGYGASKLPLRDSMRAGWEGTKATVSNLPIVGKPIKAGLSAAVKSWKDSRLVFPQGRVGPRWPSGDFQPTEGEYVDSQPPQQTLNARGSVVTPPLLNAAPSPPAQPVNVRTPGQVAPEMVRPRAYYGGPPVDPIPPREGLMLSAPKEQSLIQQMGGKPVEAITRQSGKPSGRLVLTPEEAQVETQQMSLAKKIASQRGMQYAAGMKPKKTW